VKIPMPSPWMADALCAEIGGELFFPEKQGSSARLAKKMCRRCDVTVECLEYALSNDIAHGVWGGKSDRERRRLRRAS
jgi:WhiB family transcriptional regulator, redox-sensing transcriptional regulator